MSATSNNRFARLLAGYFKKDWSGALLAVVILAIAIELVTDGKPFFHPSNLMTILNNSAALGDCRRHDAGHFNRGYRPIGWIVMGMIAALVGYVASYWGFLPILAILFGMALGLGIGLIHGSLVARFGMPAFIVTLAGCLSGAAQDTNDRSAGDTQVDPVFDFFGRYNPFMPLRQAFRDGSLPDWLMPLGSWVDANWVAYFRTFQMSLVIFILFFIVLGLVVKHTKLGRYIYAIGSNEQGSRQAGIDVRLYKTLAYVVCSMTAALGALMFLGRAPYAKSDYGQMLGWTPLPRGHRRNLAVWRTRLRVRHLPWGDFAQADCERPDACSAQHLLANGSAWHDHFVSGRYRHRSTKRQPEKLSKYCLQWRRPRCFLPAFTPLPSLLVLNSVCLSTAIRHRCWLPAATWRRHRPLDCSRAMPSGRSSSRLSELDLRASAGCHGGVELPDSGPTQQTYIADGTGSAGRGRHRGECGRMAGRSGVGVGSSSIARLTLYRHFV